LVVTMKISLLLREGIYLKLKWFFCSQWLSSETNAHLFPPTVLQSLLCCTNNLAKVQ
jgi:hypothetical protein